MGELLIPTKAKRQPGIVTWKVINNCEWLLDRYEVTLFVVAVSNGK